MTIRYKNKRLYITILYSITTVSVTQFYESQDKQGKKYFVEQWEQMFLLLRSVCCGYVEHVLLPYLQLYVI